MARRGQRRNRPPDPQESGLRRGETEAGPRTRSEQALTPVSEAAGANEGTARPIRGVGLRRGETEADPRTRSEQALRPVSEARRGQRRNRPPDPWSRSPARRDRGGPEDTKRAGSKACERGPQGPTKEPPAPRPTWSADADRSFDRQVRPEAAIHQDADHVLDLQPRAVERGRRARGNRDVRLGAALEGGRRDRH